MARPVSSVVAMPDTEQPEQLPLRPSLRMAYTATPAPADSRLRPLDVAECSLCGIAHPLGLLVPDGGTGCTDVRWYCKDVKSCTERWTTARRLAGDIPKQAEFAARRDTPPVLSRIAPFVPGWES
jgi:hypothetical protein